MKKYLIIALSAFVLELASTMYIRNVADKSLQMILWASLSPFITLPFAGYMVETKTWKERIKMAISQAIGYTIGSLIVFIMYL